MNSNVAGGLGHNTSMCGILLICCAARGHAAATPPMAPMNSRRGISIAMQSHPPCYAGRVLYLRSGTNNVVAALRKFRTGDVAVGFTNVILAVLGDVRLPADCDRDSELAGPSPARSNAEFVSF